jgi:hypothetical protein
MSDESLKEPIEKRDATEPGSAEEDRVVGDIMRALFPFITVTEYKGGGNETCLEFYYHKDGKPCGRPVKWSFSHGCCGENFCGYHIRRTS